MVFKYLLGWIAVLLSVGTVPAQMIPSAPVQDFRLPRFGSNGYTQWVLQGGKGIYDSAEQIRVEQMALRIYSGDERMALEMTIDSPEATLRLTENRAQSEGPIEIVGTNFKVSGVGWTWDGARKEIEVKFDVVVEFTQGLGGMLSRTPATELEWTRIQSQHLLLQTTPQAYHFEFTGAVHAASVEMDLSSGRLLAIADAPQSHESGTSTVGSGQLDSIRQISASDQVVIKQAGHVLRADAAEFMLPERTAHFSGLPQFETAGAFLSGATMDSSEGLVVVTGDAAGRAQMIVSQAGGLGLMGVDALSAETIVLAERITMREIPTGNHFVFEGAVELMSGALQMRSNRLTLFADEPASAAAASADELFAADAADGAGGDLQIGTVKQIIAEGAVRIEQSDRVATADQVTFYPQQERADLQGSPRIEHGNALITGDFMQLTHELSIVEGAAQLRINANEAVVNGARMELRPGLAIVHGATDQRVKVVLPEMPDLGYGNLQAMSLKPRKTDAISSTEDVPGRATVVQSKTLRMSEHPGHTMFCFSDTVSVNATNLDAICQRMEVTAVPVSSDSEAVHMRVETIEAFDDVVFKQTSRVATADQATIHPLEGRVVLEGNAVVTDESGMVTGHRMTLLQGQGRAIVEGGGPRNSRARMTLPQLESP